MSHLKVAVEDLVVIVNHESAMNSYDSLRVTSGVIVSHSRVKLSYLEVIANDKSTIYYSFL